MEAVCLCRSQWAWLVQHAAAIANYPITIGMPDDDGSKLMAHLGMRIPSKIEGASKQVECFAAAGVPSGSYDPESAWVIATKIADGLHNDCMASLIANLEFRNFIVGRDGPQIIC